MIARLFRGLVLADTHDDLLRNIVSMDAAPDPYDDLSPRTKDWQSAAALEMLATPPVFSGSQPVIERPFEEARWNEAIGYPFRHWRRSRFSDGSFGAWYGAATLATTIHETVHHWRHGLLADAGFERAGLRIERRVFKVRCDAALVDLRPQVRSFPKLVEPVDYSLTNQVGARLHREGHPGLVTASARTKGDVYCLLNPAVLGNPRHACSLSYTLGPAGVMVKKGGKVLLRLK